MSMPKLAENKKAFFDYEILETFEGGLALIGAEVKSAKAGHMQLKGAFLHIRAGELWLKNAFISKYAPAGKQESYDPSRDRKVLMHRREISRLIGKSQQEGLTLVPICVYTKRQFVKLEFGLARGKKQYEKRESIKKRDIERQLREKMRE
jgi:SsrA-binding protein